jgi:hypothetical protein
MSGHENSRAGHKQGQDSRKRQELHLLPPPGEQQSQRSPGGLDGVHFWPQCEDGLAEVRLIDDKLLA